VRAKMHLINIMDNCLTAAFVGFLVYQILLTMQLDLSVLDKYPYSVKIKSKIPFLNLWKSEVREEDWPAIEKIRRAMRPGWAIFCVLTGFTLISIPVRNYFLFKP
jgi:hypothetical protein